MSRAGAGRGSPKVGSERWRTEVKCDGCKRVMKNPHYRGKEQLVAPCPHCGVETATYAHRLEFDSWCSL